MSIKNHFLVYGFVLSLTLKQRLEATWKWPIERLGENSNECDLAEIKFFLKIVRFSHTSSLMFHHHSISNLFTSVRQNRKKIWNSVDCSSHACTCMLVDVGHVLGPLIVSFDYYYF